MLVRSTGTSATDCPGSTLPVGVVACGKESEIAVNGVACPVPTYTDACARLSLPLPGPLASGPYELVYQVVHLDSYVERTVVKFTVDPAYIAPSPSPTASPRPSSSPSSSPSTAPSPSRTPTPSAASPSISNASPPVVPTPSHSTPPDSTSPDPSGSTSIPPTPEPSSTPNGSPSVSPLPSLVQQHDPYTLTVGQWWMLVAVLVGVAATAVSTARSQRLS